MEQQSFDKVSSSELYKTLELIDSEKERLLKQYHALDTKYCAEGYLLSKELFAIEDFAVSIRYILSQRTKLVYD